MVENYNPRAARTLETGYFYTAMLHCAQIRADIEKLAVNNNQPVAELKPILIPADILWFLTDTYLDTYKMLLKEKLIKEATLTKVTPTIN